MLHSSSITIESKYCKLYCHNLDLNSMYLKNGKVLRLNSLNYTQCVCVFCIHSTVHHDEQELRKMSSASIGHFLLLKPSVCLLM